MIPLNHQFFSAIFLTVLCMAVSLAGTVTDDWSSGSALMGGSEYFSNVQLGLWYGINKATSSRPERTFYYGWCESGTPAYDGSKCFSLTAARVGACLGVCLMLTSVVVIALLGTFVIKLRLEPTMARVAAVFAGSSTACFVLCVALWAQLILTLSQRGATNKAALSIGISWLAQCGACLLALLATVNLVLAARRIDRELVELGNAARRSSKAHLRSHGHGHSNGSHREHKPSGNSPVPI